MCAVIVNFMCQPHYIMVPGYEVNHYSSYLCESIFKIRLTFKSVDLIELIAIIMWGTLSDLWKTLIKNLLSQGERILPADCLWT